MKLITLFFSLTVFLSNCTNNGSRLIDASNRNDLKVTRLGQTNYYLNLATDFELTQARGKEGQIGYDIFPKDQSPRASGFIEIDEGQRLHDAIDDWGILKEKVQSKLLNHETIWRIYQTETGRYVAETSKRNVYASVSAGNIVSVDSLIAIIATLRKN